MKKIIYLPLFFLAFPISCSNKNAKKEILNVSDIKLKNIYSEEIIFDEMPMFPKGCSAVDSFLVLFEPKLNDGFLSLYSLTSNKLIKRYGKIGNGPCEFINPRFFSNYPLNKKYLLIGDSKYLYRLNLDSILMGYNHCENSILNYIPAQLKGYNYILKSTDSIIIANVTGDSQLTFVDLKNNKSFSKNYFSKLKALDNINDFCYSTQVYDAYYSSYNGKIIIAYKYFKYIDIISENGDKLKSIYFPNFDANIPKIKKINEMNVEIKDALNFYTFAYPTEKYFYCLCWNATSDEIDENKAIPEIHIFNWDGDLTSILKPDRPISYFCIFDDKIYAIGMSSDFDLKIYKYPNVSLN
ncbi:MAG: hypothetical protein GX969_08810 [Firmicutes bacterium]|nr:hypothetical protein [Bacillota bacterium]